MNMDEGIELAYEVTRFITDGRRCYTATIPLNNQGVVSDRDFLAPKAQDELNNLIAKGLQQSYAQGVRDGRERTVNKVEAWCRENDISTDDQGWNHLIDLLKGVM